MYRNQILIEFMLQIWFYNENKIAHNTYLYLMFEYVVNMNNKANSFFVSDVYSITSQLWILSCRNFRRM